MSVTVNTGSTTSNGGELEVAESVTITSLPIGPAVKKLPFNQTPSAHQPSSGVIVQSLTATQLSAQHVPANVLQHSGGPLKVASKLVKVCLKATYPIAIYENIH